MASDPLEPAPDVSQLPAIAAPTSPPASPPPLAYAPPVRQARLHPLTLFFAAWNAIRGFLIPALVVIFLRRNPRGGLGWVPVAATMGAAAVAWAMLKYFTFSYWISETPAGGELIIRSGVLSKTERHIPLARVQDVRLRQGPMHRLLRVVEVQIETAGGQGAEAKLSVLSQAEATRLREAIFAHRVALVGAGATVADATAPAAGAPVPLPAATAPPRHTVRRVSTRELILAGLTSNQVASGLAVVGAAFALLDDLVDLKTMGPTVVRAEQSFKQWLEAGGPLVVALVIVGAVSLLAAIGLVISVFGSVLLFHGFELSLAGEDLHRSYGLFTRHASSLPRRRIQLLRVEEGLLRRMLKLATLRVNSAGSSPAENEDKHGDDVLLPVVPRGEVASLLPSIFPDAAEHARPDWRQVSRRAIWRGTFRGSVLVLAVTTGLVLLKGLIALALLALIPAVYSVNVLGYRYLGYAQDASFFRTRRGWLSRLTHVLPIRNVQAIVIRQNPLDRRHGVGTVQVDTAGQGAGTGPHVANVPWNEALALATGLAHQAATERYRW